MITCHTLAAPVFKKTTIFWVVVVWLYAPVLSVGAQENIKFVPHIKPRIIVTTDIGGDPDDQESLIRLLLYSDQFDIEGLVAVWMGTAVHEDIIRKEIAAYAEVRTNLLKQAAGFPTAESLLAVVGAGQSGRGMNFVGDGKSTTGSRLIIAAVEKDDPRPLWITCWGGEATLAQALYDARASRSPAEMDKFIAKIHVYAISDQDDAGPWIRREFPKLFYIVSPSPPMPDWFEYYRATWTGISGDRFFNVGVSNHFNMVDNPWLETNIIQNHGPLGATYPPLKYIMEGDTPSFLGLVDHGLGSEISPAYGGWGGRYVLYLAYGEAHPIWTDNMKNRDTVIGDNGRVETSNQATIWRWREAFQNDFAARMNWCTADDFRKANHNPRPVLNGNCSTDVMSVSAEGGSTICLSADGTDDPDGNKVILTWWIYQEAGNIEGAILTHTNGLRTEVKLPKVKRTGTLHVILQAEDDGTPHLFAYRRIVIEVAP